MLIKRALEAYAWRAVYDDDTSLQENEKNNFSCVDQSRVKAVLLQSRQGVPHRVDIPHGAQAVFFRRRTLEINPLSGEEYDRPSISCIGWKSDESAVYLFVRSDGSTLLSTDLQAV